MPGTDWSEAVEIAMRRLVARTGSSAFTRRQLIEEELVGFGTDRLVTAI